MTVVLSLTLAGAAHALTVEIVLPSTDSTLIAVDRPQAFEAVAYDDQQQDVTSEVTWSWDFGDGSAADTDNPTEHVFETAGDYTVTVTGAWSAQQQEDDAQVGVDAQEPTGAFVLARQLPGGAYESLQGTEVCHHRYLIVLAGYEAVQFKCKYPWDAEFRDGMLLESMEQITLDGQQRLAWVLLWPTSECPGQAEAGIFNGPMTWQIVGHYTIAEHNPPEMEQLIGEPTYTVNNTVVSSSTGVLLFDPEDEELDSCEISWTTTHQDVYNVKFRVPIHIYDLAGNELYTHTETDVPLGNGGWTWDGTIFEQEPGGPTMALKGIYTYRLGVVASAPSSCGGVHCMCTGEPSCARGDWDKSAFLEISNVATPDWGLEILSAASAKLTFSVSYWLSAQANGVGVRLYDQHLNAIHVDATLPTSPGGHATDPYVVPITLTDGWTGPYFVVVCAWESATDGEKNRNRAIKPACERGVVRSFPPQVLAFCRKDSGDPWVSWRPIAVNQQMRFCGFERGITPTITKREWNFGEGGDWVEVGQEEECYHTYTSIGEKTATYRITLQNQTTMQDTCQVTVFGFDGSNYLWFFDGCQPANYPTTGTLTATGASTGIFRWQITAETDNANFTGDYPTNVTKIDDNTVELESVGPSAVANDTRVEFYYRRGSYPEYGVFYVEATAETPSIHSVTGPNDVGYFLGFWTTYRLYVRGKIRSTVQLTSPLAVNESFGSDGHYWYDPVTGDPENWGRASANGMMTADDGGDQYFEENYRASGIEWPPWPLPNPSPVNPGQLGWQTPVYWREQAYRAGSQTPGEGRLMRTPHTLDMYRGCGRQ